MFSAVIPIKKTGMEQIEVLPFNGETLLDRKIKALKKIESIDEIIIASDIKEIKQFSDKYGIKFYLRDDFFDTEEDFSQLVCDISEIVENEEIVWSFSTTPFVDEEIIRNSISEYEKLNFDIYDSLITCTELKRFILDENGPLNFRTGKRHEESYDLPSLFVLVNGCFIMSKKLNMKYKYPWGKIPFKKIINKYSSFEIKSKKDFDIFTKVYLPNEGQI